ncbi:MAG: hypothetical protein P1P84_09995 [Deferrisomatales bacterium]|nr:hypothetical protein [Deferrisomatales bacterium]
MLKPGGGERDTEISHGICEACSRFFLDEAEETLALEQFLEDLPVPVLVLGSAGEVQAANHAARGLTGLHPSQLPGATSGDLLACANARLPEGCGHTANCGGCLVRRTLEATHASGAPQEALTGPRQVATPDGVRLARFRIATCKRGDVVLLRIDEVAAVR